MKALDSIAVDLLAKATLILISGLALHFAARRASAATLLLGCWLLGALAIVGRLCTAWRACGALLPGPASATIWSSTVVGSLRLLALAPLATVQLAQAQPSKKTTDCGLTWIVRREATSCTPAASTKQGDADATIEWLERAIEAGWDSPEEFTRDDD